MLIDLLKSNDYVTCIYGDHWWLALARQINAEVKDVPCNFLHHFGYSESFYWPGREDQAYVPFSKILSKTGPLNTLPNSGRQYAITKEKIQKKVEAFSNFQF